jgi:hypothetical protein
MSDTLQYCEVMAGPHQRLEIKVWDAPIYDGSNRIGISMLQVGQRVRVKGTAVHDDYIIATQVNIL